MTTVSAKGQGPERWKSVVAAGFGPSNQRFNSTPPPTIEAWSSRQRLTGGNQVRRIRVMKRGTEPAPFQGGSPLTHVARATGWPASPRLNGAYL